MISAATTIRGFLEVTNRRGSPARLRATLLDDAGPSGRSASAEIYAIVRAYELDIANTPSTAWDILHQQIAVDIDPTSASTALDEWATALGTTWRRLTPANHNEPLEETPASVTVRNQPLSSAVLKMVVAVTFILALGVAALLVRSAFFERESLPTAPTLRSSVDPAPTTAVPPQNQAPTALFATKSVGTTSTWVAACVLERASDLDGDILTLDWVSSPSPIGTAYIRPAGEDPNCPSQQTVYFTWPTGWTGVATMMFEVSDGRGGLADATLQITVT